MSSSAGNALLSRPRAIRTRVDADRPWVSLEDGRDIRIIEGGVGIWWDQLEDGVSVPWLFGLPEWP